MQISPYFVRFRTRLFRELQAINRRHFKDGAFFTPVAYLRPFRDPHRINPPNFPEQDLRTAAVHSYGMGALRQLGVTCRYRMLADSGE